jgi:NTP pyrophosphatase (non-canonical NTP hydrolase)
MTIKTFSMKNAINELVKVCYEASKAAGWHTNPTTGEILNRNKGEMLMLIVSEVSEAMEGERKGLMDDKLPDRPMAEVELADAVIRICDYAGRWGYDLGGAVIEKLRYNATREDHKPENRNQPGGKKF